VTDQLVEDDRWDFGSRRAFVDWCTVGFADWTARLPDGQVADWVDEVVSAYQSLLGEPGVFGFLQLRAELRP
jgi:trans-aconitate 2-methyltransferase